MMKRIFLVCLTIIGTAARLSAQQDPQFTQYMFNTLYYNPGFSGVDGVTKISAFHRSQWLGYSPTYGGGGAPTTQMITFSTPIFKLNSGFGALVSHDNLGPFNNLEGQVSYAYHLAVKNSKVSFGLRGGFYSQTVDFNMYRAIDPDDKLLGDRTGSLTQVRPDMAAGVFWRKEKFYVGLGFDHLLNSTFDFGLSQRNALQTHTYITGGYTYQVNFDLKFQFTTLVQSDLVKTSFNLTSIAYLKDMMWGGLSFRQGESMSVLLGYTFLKDKSMRLGYSLDYIVKDQAAKQPTSHELMLIYELPVVSGAGKKIVRTPRYRKS
ncbi:MAG TPA: type IX secretion system membrane protein PorP/SprF [Cyclobacteriaceae bacterium]|jgi:type IX secretion system PorP/SprF family membrane protein|nr:type IX secretion system membrane protein PorP/SprF [Cyclobacteriaceae bacterium]